MSTPKKRSFNKSKVKNEVIGEHKRAICKQGSSKLSMSKRNKVRSSNKIEKDYRLRPKNMCFGSTPTPKKGICLLLIVEY